METVLYVIEGEGCIVVNYDYPCDVRHDAPLMFEWFTGHDFIVDARERYIINSANLADAKCRVIKVSEGLFIIRPDFASEQNELKVIASESVSVNNKKFRLELARGLQGVYFTVLRGSDAYAFDLKVAVEQYKIEVSGSEILLKCTFEAGRTLTVFDTVESKIIRHSIIYNTDDVAFDFLQCVLAREYDLAKPMLAFDVSDEHLENFFSGDEVLVNNYIENEIEAGKSVISTVAFRGKNYVATKNYTFEVRNGRIINIDEYSGSGG